MLRALLLQAFYSVRSEQQLVEQLDYNLLFRWFVGLGMDDAVWNHAVFSKNRDRLLTSDVAPAVLHRVEPVGEALHERRALHRRRHADPGLGVARRAYARRTARATATARISVGRSGQARRLQSTTDPEARLYKKSYGKESKLAYLGHALVENRNGLIAAAMTTQADGHAERDAALLMLEQR